MECIVINMNDEKYPESLKQIEDPPKQLYAVGDVGVLKNTCFAIIGSRCCTEKGKNIAENMAKELCSYNMCIVSGMALGIDTAAHRRCNYCRRKNNCSSWNRI